MQPSANLRIDLLLQTKPVCFRTALPRNRSAQVPALGFNKATHDHLVRHHQVATVDKTFVGVRNQIPSTRLCRIDW